jgi:hypothetical protein
MCFPRLRSDESIDLALQAMGDDVEINNYGGDGNDDFGGGDMGDMGGGDF